MASKEIVRVWGAGGINNENIKFLKQPTVPVKFPLTENIKIIINDLKDTYKKITCAGIAANQIGYNKSIFIGLAEYTDDIDDDKLENDEKNYNPDTNDTNEYADNYEIYINPQLDYSNNKSIQEEIEGCLSIPGLSLRIVRSNKIKVRYYREDGTSIKKPMSGFMSKLFQHELDHLNGLLMIQNDVIEGFTTKDSFITPELYNQLLDSYEL